MSRPAAPPSGSLGRAPFKPLKTFRADSGGVMTSFMMVMIPSRCSPAKPCNISPCLLIHLPITPPSGPMKGSSFLSPGSMTLR